MYVGVLLYNSVTTKAAPPHYLPGASAPRRSVPAAPTENSAPFHLPMLS